MGARDSELRTKNKTKSFSQRGKKNTKNYGKGNRPKKKGSVTSWGKAAATKIAQEGGMHRKEIAL